MRTAFAADAGGLHAPEGGTQVADVVGVDPHHAGLDGVGDAVAALEIRGPDVGGQAELGGVGEFDGLGLVVEGGDGDDRAEDLLLEDPGVALHVGEDRGLEVVAVREVVGTGAARDQPAFLLADPDVVEDLFVVLGMDQGADFRGRIGGRPDPHVRRPLGEPAGELLVDGTLDQHP